MQRELEKYLWDILEATENIRSFQGEMEFAEWLLHNRSKDSLDRVER